jgi:outer membrane protein OmpA-like peptidoglycan-associated protein
MPSDALFGFDSDKLKAAAESVLLEVAAVIKKKSPLRIDIDGHTDSIGDVVYNRGLSKRRAQSVARWFIERNILKTAQITTNSYGESKPIEPNTLPNGSDNPGGREKNRRVEIFLFNK